MTAGLIERIGLDQPVIQAGMGGGLATAELAGAVSAAGGLGTVGLLAPEALEGQLRAARECADGRPVAANLLTDFTRRAHVDAVVAARADVAALHGPAERGIVERLRDAGVLVLTTVGTVQEARRALHDGADGLIVQGAEAGGHLVGVEPALDAVQRIRDATSSDALLLAGGIAEAADTRQALDAGAAGVVAGTRFLLTHESRAHDGYKQRVVEAERTFETRLFSIGWPMRHRVIPNAATERWCRHDQSGPRAVVRLASLTAPVLGRLPAGAAEAMAAMQRPAIPFFGPGAPLAGMPDSRVDAAALYAGETAQRLHTLVSAADAVAELAGTPPRPEHG